MLVTSVLDAAEHATYVIVAVKPSDVESVVGEIAEAAAKAEADSAEQVFVTIAAGVRPRSTNRSCLPGLR